ncbi:hypothetical protein AB4876_09325 [Zhongshania guokunii]|uniref:Uncharacterized protein n=1 Tax=Zhongshania guokunii TaxID=641783 RepID=A0ABV3U572_9GAMM
MSLEQQIADLQSTANTLTRLMTQLNNRQIKTENRVSAMQRRITRTSEMRHDMNTTRQQVATLSELTENLNRQVHEAVERFAPKEAKDNVTHIKRNV